MNKKILVVAPHGIGDAIMTCEAINDLFEKSDCYFLVSDQVTSNLIEIITSTPKNNIFILKKGLNFRIIEIIRLFLRLLSYKFDASICQFGVSSAQYSLMTFLLMIPIRVGWGGTLSFLNTNNISAENKHKIEATRDIADCVSNKLNLFYSSNILKKIAQINKHGNIILGISSFEDEKHKRWSLDNFSELCKLIYRDFPDRKILLLGSRDEKNYADILVKMCPIPTLNNKCGHYSIGESCSIIRDAALVIANCNAISHIAGYFGVPIIGLYGPTDPNITGPISPVFIPIRANISCAPCYSPRNNQGCSNPICMDKIIPAKVYESVTKSLKSNEK